MPKVQKKSEKEQPISNKVVKITEARSAKKQTKSAAEAKFKSRVRFKQEFIDDLHKRLQIAKIDTETMSLLKEIYYVLLAIWAEGNSKKELEI